MIITPERIANGSEAGEQKALFAWAALNIKTYPQLEWLHHIPNGGSRDEREGSSLKAQGVKKGIFDIALPYPVDQTGCLIAQWHGLYVEMKRADRRNHKNGGLTDEQVKFRDYVIANGYRAVVCYSWIEARDAIVKYLNGE